MKALIKIAASAWDSVHDSFNALFSQISPILPHLAIALIVLVLGLWASNFIGDKFVTVLKKTKIDVLIEKVILAPVAKICGVKFTACGLLGGTVKWFLGTTVLLATLHLAHLSRVVDFFYNILAYLPNIFVAVLIVIVGSMLADLTASLVKVFTKSDKNTLTTTSKLAINVLAFIAALGHVVTPIIGSLNHFIHQLNLSGLQTDALFIGIVVLFVFASKNVVTRTVESWYKA